MVRKINDHALYMHKLWSKMGMFNYTMQDAHKDAFRIMPKKSKPVLGSARIFRGQNLR